MDKEKLLTIGRPQKRCMNCDAAIDSLERHPSAIREEKNQGLERLDYCVDCWAHIKEETFESFWITRRDPARRSIRKMSRRQRATVLRALFESLWERRENEDVGPHLYFLSHLLMKWGGLKWREDLEAPDGTEVIVFEDPATGDSLEISGMPPDDETIALCKLEIEEFLRQHTPEEEALL